ncbi:MAG: PIN domain-containing protein [Actinomycetia bacterium]|nr:PIN domain-containing protein [Actinomycetes bacterium]
MDDIVLVDTDVWSELFVRKRQPTPRAAEWRRLVLGRDVLISAQTEAEIRFGALKANWGEQRLAALESRFQRTPTIAVSSEVVKAFAELKNECLRIGHPLQAKHHTGDAWIAATARAHGLPLLAGDRLFSGVPHIRLLNVL